MPLLDVGPPIEDRLDAVQAQSVTALREKARELLDALVAAYQDGSYQSLTAVDADAGWVKELPAADQASVERARERQIKAKATVERYWAVKAAELSAIVGDGVELPDAVTDLMARPYYQPHMASRRDAMKRAFDHYPHIPLGHLEDQTKFFVQGPLFAAEEVLASIAEAKQVFYDTGLQLAALRAAAEDPDRRESAEGEE